MDTISPASTTSRRLNWTNITIIGLMHVLALSAFFYSPKLKDIILFFVFYLATGFGITIGFHRLLAHRSFGCSTFLRRLFAFLGTAALQGGPIWWVGIWALGEGWHNNHHAQPGTALHNYHWWEIDPSGYVLRILERLRLIRKVTRAKTRKETIYDPSR